MNSGKSWSTRWRRCSEKSLPKAQLCLLIQSDGLGGLLGSSNGDRPANSNILAVCGCRRRTHQQLCVGLLGNQAFIRPGMNSESGVEGRETACSRASPL
nr:hypothetical protein Itr_chr01CG10150 [Ipomoea trifida]